MGIAIRTAVVAPDPMLRMGAAGVLRESRDIEVVDTPESAQVVVVIVGMVDEAALEMVGAVRQTSPAPEVVLVAEDVTPERAVETVDVGARGLLCWADAEPARMARAVVAAAGGDCTVGPMMFARLLDQPGSASPRNSELSDREQAVLRLVADGRETGEIAQELSWSPRTVVGIVHDVTQRFRLRNRAHAVAYALRAGML